MSRGPGIRCSSSLGIGQDTKIVLLSASGSGIGGFLVERVVQALGELGLGKVVLVVTGLSGPSNETEVRYLGVERDNQNFIAAADLVISMAGKSTIDEARSYGSPIIAIPIKNHSEQESNAAALGFKPEDIDRLDLLIPKYLGKRTEPQSYRGADAIASFVQDLV